MSAKDTRPPAPRAARGEEPAIELIDIARLEEARQARGLARIAGESRPFGGGTAGRDYPGSWLNNAVGMGLGGPVPAGELDAIIDWYAGAGIEPRFEVSPFADAGFVRVAADRGMVVRDFENVFYREIEPALAEPGENGPPGLEIAPVDPRDEAAVREYAFVAVSGFMPPGTAPGEKELSVAARGVRSGHGVGFAARLDGRVVGAGGMEVGEVCALFGLSVLPEYRRRGVQRALIAARLAHAARTGARLATIGSRPGVATERNVRRMGFQLGYTKVILVKPGAGLTPIIG